MMRRRKAADSLQDVISRIGNDLSALGEVMGESASAEVKATLKSLRQRLDDLADDSDSLITQGIHETRGTIAENPLIAVAAAFGLGIVLAAALRR
jgi:ElaB/YqjD/DUF883 family membrane-anchored ribosome-binding protein